MNLLPASSLLIYPTPWMRFSNGEQECISLGVERITEFRLKYEMAAGLEDVWERLQNFPDWKGARRYGIPAEQNSLYRSIVEKTQYFLHRNGEPRILLNAHERNLKEMMFFQDYGAGRVSYFGWEQLLDEWEKKRQEEDLCWGTPPKELVLLGYLHLPALRTMDCFRQGWRAARAMNAELSPVMHKEEKLMGSFFRVVAGTFLGTPRDQVLETFRKAYQAMMNTEERLRRLLKKNYLRSLYERFSANLKNIRSAESITLAQTADSLSNFILAAELEMLPAAKLRKLRIIAQLLLTPRTCLPSLMPGTLRAALLKKVLE